MTGGERMGSNGFPLMQSRVDEFRLGRGRGGGCGGFGVVGVIVGGCGVYREVFGGALDFVHG